MSEEKLNRLFNRARVDDRQINELIGLAHGIISDGNVNQAEAEHLQKWLAANAEVSGNPVVGTLFWRVDEMLRDGHLDANESAELLDTLTRFAGGDFELGEMLKSTDLPLDDPQPVPIFQDRRYCFTGTFAYGSRSDCSRAIESHGGVLDKSLTGKTDYLVVGAYATDSWLHSAWGKKVEKALNLRKKGGSIAIIGESHWVGFVG